MAGCCLRATRRTACRHSARAEPTRACKTPKTWPGSWPPCCRAGPRTHCWTADENIRNSTRATDFITPKSEISRLFRDATLTLGKRHAFARVLVNSGRLSVPATLHGSPLNSADTDPFSGAMVPGAAATDAPLADGRWLLRACSRTGFTALVFGDDAAAQAIAQADLHEMHVVQVPLDNALAVQRYDAQPGTVYLLRPDQHVCARWRAPTPAAIRHAHQRALAA
jgi:3-(3-hydroxy-phenyl)propionate hydroxylase